VSLLNVCNFIVSLQKTEILCIIWLAIHIIGLVLLAFLFLIDLFTNSNMNSLFIIVNVISLSLELWFALVVNKFIQEIREEKAVQLEVTYSSKSGEASIARWLARAVVEPNGRGSIPGESEFSHVHPSFPHSTSILFSPSASAWS
jgi:hypothetical protein